MDPDIYPVITVDNSPTFKQWVDDLATTEAPQVRETLARRLSPDPQPTIGFCCLGLGCALIPDIIPRDGLIFGGSDSMPPLAFHEWLGIQIPEVAHERIASGIWSVHDRFDVLIDWPRDALGYTYRVQGSEEQVEEFNETGLTVTVDLVGAAELNDVAGLTFAQIADVLRYFGVKNRIN